MPPRVFLILIAGVIAAAGVTIALAQALAWPWLLSGLAMAALLLRLALMISERKSSGAGKPPPGRSPDNAG